MGGVPEMQKKNAKGTKEEPQRTLRLDLGGGLFGFGSDGMGGVGFGDGGIVGDALEAFLEPAEAFPETLAELGELASAKEENGDAYDDDDVPGLKCFHRIFS